MDKFGHINAYSVAQALSHLGESSRPIAGGTDLLTVLKAGIAHPELLINLKTLDEARLRSVEQRADGGLSIGALVTLDELERHALLGQGYTALAQAAGLAASPQLRNMGTLGGNLCQEVRCWYYRGPFNCWLKGGEVCYARSGENSHHAIFGLESPCVAAHPSDPAVALLALEAQLRIAGPAGERLLDIESFFALPEAGRRRPHVLAPNELIVGLELPPAPAASRYLKAMDRQVWSFALTSVAVTLRLADDNSVQQARIVLGGVAPIPWRRQAAEAVLQGAPLSEERIERAAAQALEDARPLAHNGYKLELARGLVRQALDELL